MSLPRNLQRRSKSSTRVLLARDLHDSLAQDLVAIGFKLDLLLAKLPFKYRASVREIRFLVSESAQKVRRELFNLRDHEVDFHLRLESAAAPLPIKVSGNLQLLEETGQRIVQELVRNAALHSKGRQITVEVTEHLIKVSDDGQGLFGISELVAAAGGAMQISCDRFGTSVEIKLP